MTKDMKEFLKMMHDDIRNRNLGKDSNILAEDMEWFDMLRPYCECDDGELKDSISSNVAHLFCGNYNEVHEGFIEVVQLWRDDNEEMEVCI